MASIRPFGKQEKKYKASDERRRKSGSKKKPGKR